MRMNDSNHGGCNIIIISRVKSTWKEMKVTMQQLKASSKQVFILWMFPFTTDALGGFHWHYQEHYGTKLVNSLLEFEKMFNSQFMHEEHWD